MTACTMSRPSRWWRSCERRSPLRRCPGRWKWGTHSCPCAAGRQGRATGSGWQARGAICGGREMPVLLQHLPDGRVREPGRAGDEPRPPARLPPTGADRLLELGREPMRTVRRSTRAIEKAGAALPFASPCISPPLLPAMSGRYRDVERPRRLTDRASALDREHQLLAPGKSELGVTVKLHPALLLGVVVADAQPGRRTGLPRQPFTTCVGGTTRA